MDTDLRLRPATPADDAAIGALLVESYAALPGMPGPAAQPEYYARLRDVARRRADPAIEIHVAVSEGGRVVGTVDLITDLRGYGAGPSLAGFGDATGIRLLAVDPRARGQGVGLALSRRCIARSRALGRRAVLLHTTRAMATAWRMYERLGFARLGAIDFRQGELEVFGFRLELGPANDG